MSDSDKQAFSQAGLAHILAVSGLHIGVITIILSALLFPIRGPRMNKFKFFAILACIWFYVAFTGLSSSAIRAAIMVSFVYASKIFYASIHPSTLLPPPLSSSWYFPPMQFMTSDSNWAFSPWQASFSGQTTCCRVHQTLSSTMRHHPCLSHWLHNCNRTTYHLLFQFIPYKLFHHKLCHSPFAAINTASECIRDSNSRIGIPTWRIDWFYRLALRVYDSNIPLLYQLPASGQQHLDWRAIRHFAIRID